MEFASSVSSYDYGYTTPIKEIHWLASVVSGIILCFLVSIRRERIKLNISLN